MQKFRQGICSLGHSRRLPRPLLFVSPSDNYLVRFLVLAPGLVDRPGVTGHGSFAGHY